MGLLEIAEKEKRILREKIAVALDDFRNKTKLIDVSVRTESQILDHSDGSRTRFNDIIEIKVIL